MRRLLTMRRALLGVVAALIAALCCVTPAHAFADDNDPAVPNTDTDSVFDPAASSWWPRTSCIKVGESAHLCLDVYGRRLAGGGFSMEHVYERITGGFWENNAYSCDYVEMWTGNGTVRWKRGAPACDVDKAPPYTLFHPNLDFPNASAYEVRACGWPHLDKEVDPGRVCVHVNIP